MSITILLIMCYVLCKFIFRDGGMWIALYTSVKKRGVGRKNGIPASQIGFPLRTQRLFLKTRLICKDREQKNYGEGIEKDNAF